MFKEIIEKLQLEFVDKQNAIINGIGADLKEIVNNMSKIEGLDYGDPPYAIVDEEDNALLIVDKDGNYYRLKPFFTLTDEAINYDANAIYSVPFSDFNVIRFVSLKPGSEFTITQDPDVPININGEYIELVDERFDKYVENMIDLSKQIIAKELVRLHQDLSDLVEDADIKFDDIIKSPEVVRGLHGIFNMAISNASERMLELTDIALSNISDEGD